MLMIRRRGTWVHYEVWWCYDRYLWYKHRDDDEVKPSSCSQQHGFYNWRCQRADARAATVRERLGARGSSSAQTVECWMHVCPTLVDNLKFNPGLVYKSQRWFRVLGRIEWRASPSAFRAESTPHEIFTSWQSQINLCNFKSFPFIW